MESKPDKMEDVYFAIKVAVTVLILAAGAYGLSKLSSGEGTAALTTVTTLTTFIVYVLILVVFVLFQKLYLVGVLKGNGIEVTERQFPEVYAEYRAMGEALGLKKLPALFILQQGGLLNAFAIRFSGTNYIAVYSDVFALLESDMDCLRFILGHELGHVKRAHMSKRFWTCLSSIVPFLTPAYSRRCELTCDGIGASCVKESPLNGLVLLAAGPVLYRKVDIAAYLEDARRNRTASAKFVGLCLSHPYLPARLSRIRAKLS